MEHIPLAEAADQSALEKSLGLSFRKPILLRRALTHRSASGPTLESNERLEFLGDAVVGLVAGEELYRKHPDSSEGTLAKSRAYVVSETSLAEAARRIGLEPYILMSLGEETMGGRNRPSLLSDAFEALIGAIYLDRGLRAARSVLLNSLSETLQASVQESRLHDHKSSLQEYTQALNRTTPKYRVLCETGSEHDKTFIVEAVLEETPIGEGEGKSKKQAEQAAAAAALQRLNAG